ncbi:MAG: UDP-N-acetylmuramate dehydrogenase [Clostridia bacterium]|nr:UDP-N-acetylmuramate dehydrogenase [Clostridia bacterium]
MELLRNQLVCAGVRVEANTSLRRYSSFRIGGNARLGLFPKNREELLVCLETVRRCGVPFLVIGNASNVVFSDSGFDGAVIFTTAWKELSLHGNRMYVSAGTPLISVATAAHEAALTGAEFAYGIPATLGGAVFMNAGAFGGCMADICETSAYYDTQTGEMRTLCGAEQAFANRTSIYEKNPHYTILSAELVLREGDKEAIGVQMRDYMERRRKTQPLEYPSAGSVFKRPVGYYAGKLIEDCGLKGTRVGGAEVSIKHAGFIINRGNATADDVRRLVELIQERVLKESGVTLECEIRFL